MDKEKLTNDSVDETMLDLLKSVIGQANEKIEDNDIGRALLFFTVRIANTWRSIRTLRNNTADAEGFTVDAGTLLRAMFDAYLQAEYIVHEPNLADQLASDYLEFEHVERFKSMTAVMKHENSLSEHLKASPKRTAGEARINTEYDRVKSRYFIRKKRADGTIKVGPATRNTWHENNLAEIARLLGKEDEYDTLLRNFHGCVHSSPFAVRSGPMLAGEHVVDWASTIAARVAKLNVDHHNLRISEIYTSILSVLCKPYF
ncbi:DUF5677 domain-containing protein [Rhodopirellula sp. UBA1907]|uniref:DUF5677 domain-containing protein n=1 Tax=Rhodopirellula sp. UBA1907 TaxID=1947381 RepID=UPI0025801A2C|nr:DUF5677 domain-containing protein [Rhodopirellula sp. UBA1907]